MSKRRDVIKNREYVLSFSFGNFLKGDGGTDKVIAEHQALFNEVGISYVQVAPIKSEKGILGMNFYTIVIDGVFFSVMHEQGLLHFIFDLAKHNYGLRAIFIHHLMKFNISFIQKVIDNTDAPVFFYIHDYFTVCNNYRLIRSDGSFCGDDPVSKTKCNDCEYFEKAYNHRKKMNAFFNSEADRIKVIAPSQAALDIWKKSFDNFKINSCVIPHLKAIDNHKTYVGYDTRKIKIAYLGKMIPTKGSLLWEKLVENDSLAQKYDLMYIGNSEYESSNVTNIKVTVTKDNPKLMVDTLINNNIDIAILWSTIPETYSYTYYEASEAGCYVITNKNSGNIAQSIIANCNGRIFNKEEDAIDFINDYEAIDLALRKNADRGHLSYSQNDEILNLLGNKAFSFRYNEGYCFFGSVVARIIKTLYIMKYKKWK